MTRVVQVTPGLAPGDAVSGHVRAIRDQLARAGVDSSIVTSDAHPDVRQEATVVAGDGAELLRSLTRPGDLVIYHVAVGSPLADGVAAVCGAESGVGLVLDHHNITPADHLQRWAPELVYAVEWGRRQLAELVPSAELGMADSPTNELELIELGGEPTAVVPIFVDFDRLVPDAERVDALRSRPGTRWLFVGRQAPNKAPHTLLAAVAWARRALDVDVRLDLVGPPFGWIPVVLKQAWASRLAMRSPDGPNELDGDAHLRKIVHVLPDLTERLSWPRRFIAFNQIMWPVIMIGLVALGWYGWKVYDEDVIKGGFFGFGSDEELFVYLRMPDGTDVQVTSESIFKFEQAVMPVEEGVRMRSQVFGNQGHGADRVHARTIADAVALAPIATSSPRSPIRREAARSSSAASATSPTSRAASAARTSTRSSRSPATTPRCCAKSPTRRWPRPRAVAARATDRSPAAPDGGVRAPKKPSSRCGAT